MLASLIAYIRRHHVAYLALAVALGGTAYALSTDSVRSRHIKDGQVKPNDLGALEFAQQNAQNNVPAGTEENGPAVALKVPSPGIVAVMARADIRLNTDATFNYCAVSVDTGITDNRLISEIADLDGLRTHFSAPGTRNDGTVASSTQWSDGGWTLVEVPTGAVTFELELNSVGSSSCDFANVRLWAAPVG